MPLEIVRLPLGPMDNNTYLLADTESGQTVVIDPSFDSEMVIEAARKRGWTLAAIWLTHAHFDHIAGVQTIQSAQASPLPVSLHPDDLPLWRQGGGARLFGMQMEIEGDPEVILSHGQTLRLGSHAIEVRHTPGHTPGHVVFYAESIGAVICGDLIFYHGVGRTDLPGGNHETLLNAIRTQILTLPPSTRLFSGHGMQTSIAEEAANNPFL